MLDRGEHGLVRDVRIARGVDQDAAGRVVGGDLLECLPERMGVRQVSREAGLDKSYEMLYNISYEISIRRMP